MKSIIAIILLSSISLVYSQGGRGLGEDINWVPLDEGLKMAKAQNKPMMVVVHNDWCNECRKLKEKLAEAPEREEIVSLSRRFIMVNMVGKEEPDDREFSPDGHYTPRIIFYYPNGKRMSGITNTKRHRYYLHFYDFPEDILADMEKALASAG